MFVAALIQKYTRLAITLRPSYLNYGGHYPVGLLRRLSKNAATAMVHRDEKSRREEQEKRRAKTNRHKLLK